MRARKRVVRWFAAGAAALGLFAFASGAEADIYRWVDEQGTLHFTDDPSSIPSSKREGAVPFIKEPPSSTRQDATAPEVVRPVAEPPAEPSPEPVRIPPSPPPRGKADLEQEIEQLRAKIAAKESLIRAVDEKRSLATNPLRNRFVSPADLELYQKYQLELPSDRDRLSGMEDQLSRDR